MAQKLTRKVAQYLSSKKVPEFTAHESEQEKYFYIVAATLLAGHWYRDLPVPPVKKDIETGEWWPEVNKAQFISEASSRVLHKTVVLCDDGKLGPTPGKTKRGDEIWIFMGARTSSVLRKLDEVDGDKKVYRFIGSAYLHGVMKGESMEDLEKGKYELQNLALR